MAEESIKVADDEEDLAEEIEKSIKDESLLESDLQQEIEEPIESEKIEEEINCPINRKNLVGKWKSSFPSNTIELFYTCELAICTYELILYVIKDYIPDFRNLTLTGLKNELVKIYKNYVKYLPVLFKILESQGKGSLIRMVKNGEINFDDLLLTENYYLTNLDISLIALHYNIPLIFLSSTVLQENNKTFMIINSTNKLDYYFIRTPGVRTEGYPVQRLFIYDAPLINIRDLKDKFRQDIEKVTDFNFIEDYVKTFEKKKKVKLVVVDKE